MLLDVITDQSLWTLLSGLLGLALLNLAVRTILSILYLGHVPGPWYTHLSNHVLQYHEFNHHRTAWIHQLHAKYGPVVRLSATEVHFNDIKGVKAIYGVRAPVVKDSYYEVFRHRNVQNMFSTISDADHAKKKRGIANIYSRSSVMRPDSMKNLHDRVDELIALLDNPDGVELYLVLSYLTLDVVSTFVYGNEYRARTLSGHEKNQRRVKEDMMMNRDWSRFWKKGGHSFLEKIVIIIHLILGRLNSLLEIYSAGEEAETLGGVEAYIADACAQSSAASASFEKRDGSVIDKLISNNGHASYVLSESRDHVLAGSDTTTTVLTYLFHTLATSTHICEALRIAVQQIEVNDRGQIDAAALDACEYLDQVITEALRLYAAIPITLPRVAMAQMTINGLVIPAGTQVGAQCFSLHRDPSIFSAPDTFDPTRWQNPTKRMRDQMWAFSSGSRSCIGRALALMEMKLVVARVVQEYSFTVIGLQADGMEMAEDTTRFTMVPKDRKMKMLFSRR